MTVARWQCVLGHEAIDAFHEGELKEIVPQCSGLYLWRRRISCTPRELSTPEDFQEWIRRLTEGPTAVVSDKEITHCLKLRRLELGGGGLTTEKEQTLVNVTKKRKMRERIAQIVESLTEFSPPIYVGNANDLHARVRQHLRSETSLAAYLTDQLALDWSDTELHYHQLSSNISDSPEARGVRELLELVAQRHLSPVGTNRPG